MILTEQFLPVFFAVYLVTIISFFVLKHTIASEKLRSSQQHPANIGKTAIQAGGLVIVPITLCASFLVLFFVNNVPIDILLLFSLPVSLLFIIGVADDIKSISIYIRLAAHLINAFYITVFIYQTTGFSGLDQLTMATGVLIPSIFMILAVTWSLNSINFIDGMDLFLAFNILPGIVLFSLLSAITTFDAPISVIFLIFLAALLGFCWFNKPTASIYMGDAGTLCIGFALGSCGIFILSKYGSIAGFIPFAYIFVDTTFTLVFRIFKRHNLFQSHDQHAYQIARKRGVYEHWIRSICLSSSILNTILAYFCFHFNHIFMWQVILGMSAFLTSTLVFFIIRNKSCKPKEIKQN